MEEVKFADNSLLEERGFEPPVPLTNEAVSSAEQDQGFESGSLKHGVRIS